MNVELLRLLQAVRRRQEIAVRLHGREAAGRVMSGGVVSGMRHAIQWYRLITALPLRLPSPTRFYFDSGGSPVSKSGIAMAELCEGGAEPETIYSPPWPPRRRPARKLVRFLARLPRAVALHLVIRRRVKRLADDDLVVIIGRDAFVRFLRRHPGLRPVIISDSSPVRLMLGAAAAISGNQAVWWQDDYHFTSPPAFTVHSAAILNEMGGEGVRRRSPGVHLYVRPGSGLSPARTISAQPEVGVAVNDLFTGSMQEIDLLHCIQQSLRVRTLHLRLHPNSDLTSEKLSRPWLAVARREEPLEEFACRMAAVIVGNSAAQVPILTLGTPVIHVSGLDPLGFDMYGYVGKGVVFGTNPLQPDILMRMDAFYSSGEYLRELSAVVTTSNIGAAPLRELASR